MVIAFELKLNISNESSKLEVMQQLQNYLVEKHARNRQVVVFVEEAQSMPIETLEEIRLLSNLETNDHKLLQMVLFGQPELDEKLRDPSIRQLKERITHSFYLDPFPTTDIYEYLNFRMRSVGYRGPDIFSQRVANHIEKKSRGLTRRINILADKALMAVYSEGAHDVKSKHISIAADDSDFGTERNYKPLMYSVLAVVVIALAVWIGTLIPQTQQKEIVVSQPEVQEQKPVTVAEPTIINAPVTIPVAAEESILEQRLQATRHWLASANDNDFTIQLTLLDAWATDIVINYLQSAANDLEHNNLYVYEAVIQGRAVYSILYNSFENRNQAVQGLSNLPNDLRADGAFLRTVKGIQSDIRKSKQISKS